MAWLQWFGSFWNYLEECVIHQTENLCDLCEATQDYPFVNPYNDHWV